MSDEIGRAAARSAMIRSARPNPECGERTQVEREHLSRLRGERARSARRVAPATSACRGGAKAEKTGADPTEVGSGAATYSPLPWLDGIGGPRSSLLVAEIVRVVRPLGRARC